MDIRIKKILFRVLILFSVVAISYIIIFIVKNKSDQTTETNPQESQSTNKIIPGQTDRQSVENDLGTPTSTNENISYYTSKNPSRDVQIVYKEGVVDLVITPVDYRENRNTDEITSVYKDTPYTLYGVDSVNGYYLFVYPDKGIAYLGNPISKNLLEIWNFPPVNNISQFLSNWGSEYSLTEPRLGP